MSQYFYTHSISQKLQFDLLIIINIKIIINIIIFVMEDNSLLHELSKNMRNAIFMCCLYEMYTLMVVCR